MSLLDLTPEEYAEHMKTYLSKPELTSKLSTTKTTKTTTTTTKNKKNNRFAKGSGVYTCINCGKRTRDTGEGAEVRMCKKCYQEAEEENARLDNE